MILKNFDNYAVIFLNRASRLIKSEDDFSKVMGKIIHAFGTNKICEHLWGGYLS